MTTITRERAQKIIDAADEVITALAGTNEDVHPESDNMLRLWDDLNDRYAPPEVVRELARIALASLEAASRSTTSYPEKLPCPVFLEPGLRFSKGVTTSLMLDALQRRAEYHAELDVMTPEQRAEHDAGIAEFKAMLGQPIITDNFDLITDKQPEPVMVAECEICGKGCTNAGHPMKAVAVEPPLSVSERAELQAFRRAACNHGFPPGAHTQGVIGCVKCSGRQVMIWEQPGSHNYQIPGLKREEITPGMALHLGVGSDSTNDSYPMTVVAVESPVIGIDPALGPDRSVEIRYVAPPGWVMVPIEPTEHMIVEGFESEPDEFFSEPEVWKAYQAMSGCRQAAHRAKLCWAAMIAAVPTKEGA
ncbi:TPA: hypothetical protein ACHP0M_005096 [Citrobacter freundii]